MKLSKNNCKKNLTQNHSGIKSDFYDLEDLFLILMIIIVALIAVSIVVIAIINYRSAIPVKSQKVHVENVGSIYLANIEGYEYLISPCWNNKIVHAESCPCKKR